MAIVVFSYAMVDPYAMMIKTSYASIMRLFLHVAYFAVSGAIMDNTFTKMTE